MSSFLYQKFYVQKQPAIGIPRKSWSKNMQQIYRRTPMRKCKITLGHGCSPVNLIHIFTTPFPKNTPGWLLLYVNSACLYNSNVWFILLFLEVRKNEKWLTLYKCWLWKKISGNNLYGLVRNQSISFYFVKGILNFICCCFQIFVFPIIRLTNMSPS